MKTNVGKIVRALRVLLGLALLAFAYFSGHPYAWIGYIGIVPLVTAIIGNCPVYSLFGISSCPIKTGSRAMR